MIILSVSSIFCKGLSGIFRFCGQDDINKTSSGNHYFFARLQLKLAIKITSQAKSNFVWRNTSHRRVFSVNFDQACDVILFLQNSMGQAVSQNKCLKKSVERRNTAQVIELIVICLFLL